MSTPNIDFNQLFGVTPPPARPPAETTAAAVLAYVHAACGFVWAILAANAHAPAGTSTGPVLIVLALINLVIGGLELRAGLRLRRGIARQPYLIVVTIGTVTGATAAMFTMLSLDDLHLSALVWPTIAVPIVGLCLAAGRQTSEYFATGRRG